MNSCVGAGAEIERERQGETGRGRDRQMYRKQVNPMTVCGKPYSKA